MTEMEELEIRTICRICGGKFRYLGSHLVQTHNMLARDYKMSLGIQLKIPLTDPSLQKLQRQRRLQDYDREEFLKMGEGSRFKQGERRPRYVSRQFRETVGQRVIRIICPCGTEFTDRPSFLYCPKCRIATCTKCGVEFRKSGRGYAGHTRCQKCRV